MADDLERILQGLKDAEAFAKTYRFEMSDDYLALVAYVEAMPQNQAGADKTDRCRGERSYKELFRRASPVVHER